MGCLVEFMSWFVCFFPDSGGSGSGASAGSFDGGSEDRCVKFDFLLGPLCNFTLLEFVCCGVCCIFYLLQGVFCKRQDELNIWDPAPSKKKRLSLYINRFEGIHSLPAVTNLLLLIADSFLAITYSTGLILHHIGNIVHICTSPSASSLIILLDRFLMQHIRFLFVEQTTQGISTTRFFHNCQPVNVRSEEDLDGEAGSH